MIKRLQNLSLSIKLEHSINTLFLMQYTMEEKSYLLRKVHPYTRIISRISDSMLQLLTKTMIRWRIPHTCMQFKNTSYM